MSCGPFMVHGGEPHRMAVQRLKELLPIGKTGPHTYDCPECDRTFEVDAPPNRVVCSNCGNRDVKLVER